MGHSISARQGSCRTISGSPLCRKAELTDCSSSSLVHSFHHVCSLQHPVFIVLSRFAITLPCFMLASRCFHIVCPLCIAFSYIDLVYPHPREFTDHPSHDRDPLSTFRIYILNLLNLLKSCMTPLRAPLPHRPNCQPHSLLWLIFSLASCHAQTRTVRRTSFSLLHVLVIHDGV